MEARHDDHIVSANSIENAVRESLQVRPSRVTMDDLTAPRRLEYGFEHLAHCVQELVA